MIDLKSAVIVITGFPENEAEDIRRCLTTLYSVWTGEQPLDRDFGLDHEFLDKPLPVARNMCTLEIIEKTGRYEKRVAVRDIEYEFETDGRMIPIVFCERNDAV